jgi:urease accessory protein
VQSRAEIVAEVGSSGHTQLTRFAGDGPLTVRPTGTSERARVHLVAGIFGPLGGDLLTLCVRVGPGAELEVAGVAATLVLPSRDSKPSQLRIDVEVSAGARLSLTLPPTVVAKGADHTVDTRVSLAGDAQLVLREETIRGRTSEAGGNARLLTCIDRAGLPVMRQDLDLRGEVRPPWHPRVVGSLIVIGPDLKPPDDLPPLNNDVVRAAWMTLPGAAGYQLTALGPDPLAVSQLFDAQLLDGQLPRYTV